MPSRHLILTENVDLAEFKLLEVVLVGTVGGAAGAGAVAADRLGQFGQGDWAGGRLWGLRGSAVRVVRWGGFELLFGDVVHGLLPDFYVESTVHRIRLCMGVSESIISTHD